MIHEPAHSALAQQRVGPGWLAAHQEVEQLAVVVVAAWPEIGLAAEPEVLDREEHTEHYVGAHNILLEDQ